MKTNLVICKDTEACTAAAAKKFADLMAARKGARWVAGEPFVEQLNQDTGEAMAAWSFEVSAIISGKG